MKAKHEDVIKKMFFEIFESDGIDPCDWEEALSIILSDIGESYQTMSDNIDVGIKNGYSLEYQLSLCRNIYKQITK